MYQRTRMIIFCTYELITTMVQSYVCQIEIKHKKIRSISPQSLIPENWGSASIQCIVLCSQVWGPSTLSNASTQHNNESDKQEQKKVNIKNHPHYLKSVVTCKQSVSIEYSNTRFVQLLWFDRIPAYPTHSGFGHPAESSNSIWFILVELFRSGIKYITPSPCAASQDQNHRACRWDISHYQTSHQWFLGQSGWDAWDCFIHTSVHAAQILQ